MGVRQWGKMYRFRIHSTPQGVNEGGTHEGFQVQGRGDAGQLPGRRARVDADRTGGALRDNRKGNTRQYE